MIAKQATWTRTQPGIYRLDDADYALHLAPGCWYLYKHGEGYIGCYQGGGNRPSKAVLEWALDLVNQDRQSPGRLAGLWQIESIRGMLSSLESQVKEASVVNFESLDLIHTAVSDATHWYWETPSH